MGSRRSRLDAEMVRRKLVTSRAAAKATIESGDVVVAGVSVPKPASLVDASQAITLTTSGPTYASRGGLKLAGALEDLQVDVTGCLALDAGAAHGGFTDVLLRAGAERVIAIDVAYGQLAWELRQDPRVQLLERTNVRHVTSEAIQGQRPEVIVADLSFISLTKVLPALAAVAADRAIMLPMVKPQFEVGAAQVSRGGVVRDPEGWRHAVRTVAEAAQDLGFSVGGVAPSRAPGPAGNIEFFLHLTRGAQAPANALEALLDDAVAAGVALAAGGTDRGPS